MRTLSNLVSLFGFYKRHFASRVLFELFLLHIAYITSVEEVYQKTFFSMNLQEICNEY